MLQINDKFYNGKLVVSAHNYQDLLPVNAMRTKYFVMPSSYNS